MTDYTRFFSGHRCGCCDRPVPYAVSVVQLDPIRLDADAHDIIATPILGRDGKSVGVITLLNVEAAEAENYPEASYAEEAEGSEDADLAPCWGWMMEDLGAVEDLEEDDGARDGLYLCDVCQARYIQAGEVCVRIQDGRYLVSDKCPNGRPGANFVPTEGLEWGVMCRTCVRAVNATSSRGVWIEGMDWLG